MKTIQIPKDSFIVKNPVRRNSLHRLRFKIGDYATVKFRVIEDPSRYDQIVLAAVHPIPPQTNFEPREFTTYYAECIGDEINCNVLNALAEQARIFLHEEGILPNLSISYGYDE